MASTGNISFLRRLLNPLRNTCIIQIFNCLSKHNKNRKQTSTDNSEVTVQVCSKEEEINKVSTTCIKEEERHEPSDEEYRENKKQTKKVEPKEKSKPCTNEEEGCNASIKYTIEEKTHEVSPSFKAEQSIAPTTYTKNDQEVKPDFTSCTVDNMLNKKERDGISTSSHVVTKIPIQLNINWNHKEEKNWNRNDDRIPELNLKQQHKKVLQGTEWLDDEIIDAAQNLLRKQFNCDGLQSSLLCQMQFYPVNGPSVQIHYDMNHWLTSCLKQHHVEIADSLGRRYLTDAMKKQIRECYGGAVINPSCKYNQTKMRRHLICCFEKGRFTAFPKRIDENHDNSQSPVLYHMLNKKERDEKNWNRNDDWIPELNLKQQHKKELQGTELLDDQIIDAAQNLLKKQFNCEGLQSSLLSQVRFYPVYGPSVEIHYDMNHWLTSCLKQHHVEIADSLGRRYLTDERKHKECMVMTSQSIYSPRDTSDGILRENFQLEIG
ncbi:hypothetical protein XELAEV_18046433mg [Xenopus laevis]|uniref:Uncharacterized protein n=1 Tax=Xenopus laevis TaxID=8355 RepID=A0A974BTL7_XENLA|nr:hypothetical protein XELAEV_18046433mg [Xenopus laevis]